MWTKIKDWLKTGWKWVAAGFAALFAGLYFWRKVVPGHMLSWDDDDPTPRDMPPLTPAQGTEAKKEIGERLNARLNELDRENVERKKRALEIVNRARGGNKK